jgi:hypothetical protein
MLSRVFKAIMRLYPEAWRTRYEGELTVLIEDQLAQSDSSAWRIALGCLWGALSERINPSLRHAPELVPAVAGQPDLGIQAPKRSAGRVAIIVGLVLGIATLLVVVTLWFISIASGLNNWGSGLNNWGSGLNRLSAELQTGPTGAFIAASQAHSMGIPVGQITPQALSGADPHYRWVPGTVVSTLPTGSKPNLWNVSVVAGDQHVITAVKGAYGVCSLGLDVTSASDPIVAADHLSGPGLYQSALLTGDGKAHVPCAAINATGAWWSVDTGAS